MDDTLKILASYPIQAISIEGITANVSKVFDGNDTYALKRSGLTDATVLKWEAVYHQAYQSQLHELLPVYKTLDGGLAVRHHQFYYYMTPWIPAANIDDKEQMKRLYEILGSIHVKTKQSIHIDTETITKQFRDYQRQLKNHQSFLLKCVDFFEQSRFMSPVELFFCTHYQDIMTLLEELDNQVIRFIEAVNEEPEWNYSLCHGNLDFSHCLFGDHTYIINWEHACQDNPVQDLFTLYRMVTKNYDAPINEYLEGFSYYMKQNPLTEAELSLLSIYLLDPTAYIDLVMQYWNDPAKDSQINLIQQLQQAYRTLSFAMGWIRFTGDEEMDSSET